MVYKKIEISLNDKESLKKSDANMEKLINLVGDIEREYIPDYFTAIINSIIFQQVSYKAAITIWNRFENLVPDITPENIINVSTQALRECGLPTTKVKYIKNISDMMLKKEINLKNLNKMNDDEIINKLILIKGVGVWTAEMFLIFSLNRKNVLSYRDLGIRKGIQWLYNMENEPTLDEFNQFKNIYSPNNTLAAFYLWEITIRNYFKYKNLDEVIIDS